MVILIYVLAGHLLRSFDWWARAPKAPISIQDFYQNSTVGKQGPFCNIFSSLHTCSLVKKDPPLRWQAKYVHAEWWRRQWGICSTSQYGKRCPEL